MRKNIIYNLVIKFDLDDICESHLSEKKKVVIPENVNLSERQYSVMTHVCLNLQFVHSVKPISRKC